METTPLLSPDWVKALIPNRVKAGLIARFRPSSVERIEVLRGRPKVIVGLAGFYQNLGDLAITQAQLKFIGDVLPDHVIVPISSRATYQSAASLHKAVGPEDVITLIGGGNLGDLYQSLEDARLFLVRSFPRNPIVSFPQSWSFTDSKQGRVAVDRSARIYRRHPNLKVFARDRTSLSIMSEEFEGVSVELAPDVVLSLRRAPRMSAGAGALVCMRRDDEAVLARSVRELLVTVLTDYGFDVTVRDTVDVSAEACDEERFEATVDGFLADVARHQVVITDRLHCMIFCAITCTPCVVLPSLTGKISYCYHDWLSTTPSIEYLEETDSESVVAAMNRVMTVPEKDRVRPNLAESFRPLRVAIRRAAEL